MANLFQQLSPEHRELFYELMAVRDADGALLATADEAATDLLKVFVTQRGQLANNVVDRLGGQPAHGRADVLLDLVRALSGPHPIPQAWLDAQRHGGFDLFAPEYYRPRGDKEREIGSPGVYLQRMVAQYRTDVHNRRVSPANNAALYTEAALLTGVMVVKTMQKAVCAKAALGPAWVVNIAVDPLHDTVKRQMDALAGNPAYIKALGEAIASVTAAHATPDLAKRTSEDVQHSLPAGTDVGVFFAEHDARQLAKATDLLIKAIECRPATVSEVGEYASIDKAADQLIAAVDRMPSDKPDVLAARVATATSYLDEQLVLTEQQKDDHNKRLSLLMPDLKASLTHQQRIGKIIQTSNAFMSNDDMGYTNITGEARSDRLFKAIVHRINDYAFLVGPPPINTPVNHIPLFEAAANVGYLLNPRSFEALDVWKSAGLIPYEKSQSYNVSELVCNVMDMGIGAVNEISFLKIIQDLYR